MTHPKPPSPFDGIRRDRTYGGYSKTLVHNGHEVEVRILAESKDELQGLLPAALKFWRSRARWFKGFKNYVVNKLRKELNEYLDDGETAPPPVVSKDELTKIINVPFSVVLERYDDDDAIHFQMSGGTGKVLQDHTFEVRGTIDDGITEGDVVALFLNVWQPARVPGTYVPPHLVTRWDNWVVSHFLAFRGSGDDSANCGAFSWRRKKEPAALRQKRSFLPPLCPATIV